MRRPTLLVLAIFGLFTCKSLADDGIGIDAVVAKLRSVEEVTVTASVFSKTATSSDLLVHTGGGPDVKQAIPIRLRSSMDAFWLFRNDGSWRCESRLSHSNRIGTERSNGGTTHLIDIFDGAKRSGKHFVIDPQNVSALDELEEKPGNSHATRLAKPTEFLTHYLTRSVAEIIEKGNPTLVADENLNGRPYIVVKTDIEDFAPNYIAYHKFWIDFERGVVARRQSVVSIGKDKPWGVLFQTDCEDFRLYQPSGLWLPATAKTFHWTVDEHGQGKLVSVSHLSYSEWKVNPILDNTSFSIDDPMLQTTK